MPPPRQLTLERQLNKSVVIGWTPADAPPGTVDCYHVYVDGLLRTTVRTNERPRALLEGVDSNKVCTCLPVKGVCTRDAPDLGSGWILLDWEDFFGIPAGCRI